MNCFGLHFLLRGVDGQHSVMPGQIVRHSPESSSKMFIMSTRNLYLKIISTASKILM